MAVTRAFTNATNFEKRKTAHPLVINGDMAVAQRGTVTGITNPGTYTLDRFRADIRGGFGVQVAQSTTVPSGKGFKNSLKLDVTTADASPDANGLLLLGYHFEGHDLQCLKYGTSSAETITIAFYVRSNKTGTFQVNLRMAEAYHRGQLVTISSADTWEKKVITFAGNTSNAHANDNTTEMRIQFFFDSGSDHTGGGVPSDWADVDSSKDFNGSIALGDNTANEVLLTGLQVEIGEFNSDTIPEFQFESHAENLARCQRYFYKTFDQGTTPAQNVSDGNYLLAVGTDGGSRSHGSIEFPVAMRADPTITTFNPFAANASGRQPNSSTDVAFQATTPREHSCGCSFTNTSIGSYHIHITAAAEL